MRVTRRHQPLSQLLAGVHDEQRRACPQPELPSGPARAAVGAGPPRARDSRQQLRTRQGQQPDGQRRREREVGVALLRQLLARVVAVGDQVVGLVQPERRPADQRGLAQPVGGLGHCPAQYGKAPRRSARFTGLPPNPALSSRIYVCMEPRAEVHFHLLPGIDDGPAELADSVELARAAVADGTDMVVATPHVRSDFVTDVLGLRERVAEVRRALAAAGVPLAVACGGELGHDMVPRLFQDELEAIAQGPRDARWLLLEAPWEPFGEDFHAAAAELRERGFGVLIAHPERSADAELDDCSGLRRELAAGSLAQVNALSLTGGHGQT